MISKKYCERKYAEYKDVYQKIPLKKDFLRFAKIPRDQLTILYGRDAYTELQKSCGDEGNKWNLERAPRERILRQFGDLALKLKELPNSSDWIHHRLQPSISGLEKRPHNIKWPDFPSQFQEWVIGEKVTGYDEVLRYINESSAGLKAKTKVERKDAEFERVLRDIRLWSPGRRRNSEGEYKIELRAHLKSLGYRVDEEFGESNIDLLVNGKHSIETKKDPQLSEYDRLFGQLARHLQHQRNVIALIFDAPSEDKFCNFVSLVDKYLNKGESFVEVIKK